MTALSEFGLSLSSTQDSAVVDLNGVQIECGSACTGVSGSSSNGNDLNLVASDVHVLGGVFGFQFDPRRGSFDLSNVSTTNMAGKSFYMTSEKDVVVRIADSMFSGSGPTSHGLHFAPSEKLDLTISSVSVNNHDTAVWVQPIAGSQSTVAIDVLTVGDVATVQTAISVTPQMDAEVNLTVRDSQLDSAPNQVGFEVVGDVESTVRLGVSSVHCVGDYGLLNLPGGVFEIAGMEAGESYDDSDGGSLASMGSTTDGLVNASGQFDVIDLSAIPVPTAP